MNVAPATHSHVSIVDSIDRVGLWPNQTQYDHAASVHISIPDAGHHAGSGDMPGKPIDKNFLDRKGLDQVLAAHISPRHPHKRGGTPYVRFPTISKSHNLPYHNGYNPTFALNALRSTFGTHHTHHTTSPTAKITNADFSTNGHGVSGWFRSMGFSQ